MGDFIDIGEYFRRLPRSRFDQASFKINVDRLNDYVSRFGLSDEDFIKFFSLWLSLNIPVPKWLSVGRCMVPETRVPQVLVDNAMKWILVNNYCDEKVPRVAFVLSWLSGLIEYNLVDEKVLDKYYDVFIHFLAHDKYRSHVVRLAYHFTKPEDVTRWRVEDILYLIKQPMNSKSFNELSAILWRFKTLRPDLVPESVHIKFAQSAFPKLQPVLMQRFSEAEARCRLHIGQYEKGLSWSVSTFLGVATKGTKDLPLIPDIENTAMELSSGEESDVKTCLHFKSAKDLLRFYLSQEIVLPSSILTLLSNEGGMLVLALADSRDHRTLSNALHNTLNQCFLNFDTSCSTEDILQIQKTDFLDRIYSLESVLLQGIPIVSYFLFEYLMTWNGSDYFNQIMDLLEWAVFKNYTELSEYVLAPLETLFLSEDVYYRCSILKMLKKMYTNIHLANTKKHNLFVSKDINCNFIEALDGLSQFVDKLCKSSLISYPDSAMLHFSFLDFYETITELQCSSSPSVWSVIPPVFAYSALCSPSCLMIDAVIALLIKYRAVYKRVKPIIETKSLNKKSLFIEAYKEDYKNCLWFDMAFRLRNNGLLFKNLPVEKVEELTYGLEDANGALNIASHMAFASITYINGTTSKLDSNLVAKQNWLRESFYETFPHIVEFVRIVDGVTDMSASKLKNMLHRRLSG